MPNNQLKSILILAPDTRTETELLTALLRVLRVLNLLFYFCRAVQEIGRVPSFMSAFRIIAVVTGFFDSLSQIYDCADQLNADAATLARLQIVTRAQPEIKERTR